jgi:hypothetical protein
MVDRSYVSLPAQSDGQENLEKSAPVYNKK